MDTDKIIELQEMENFSKTFFSVIPGMEAATGLSVVNAESLTRESFKKDWVSRNKACLIKGAIKHWPAVEKWRRKEHWLSNCDNIKVTIYPHLNYNDPKRQMEGRVELGFHEAVDRLFQNKDHVFSFPGGQIRDKSFSQVMNEQDLPGFSFLSPLERPRLYPQKRFFMYRRAATAWHAHNMDETLMCQVNGPKRVALFSPHIEQAKYVTEFLANELHLNGQLMNADLRLKPMIADVEEGDALYIPPYWHHAVVPLDGEVGFTLAYCWRSPLHIMGNHSNYFVRDLYDSGIWPPNYLRPIVKVYSGLLHSIRQS